MASTRTTIKHTCQACGNERKVQFNDAAYERMEHSITCGRRIGENEFCHANATYILDNDEWVLRDECNCENPEPESGVALVSNDCPVHNF